MLDGFSPKSHRRGGMGEGERKVYVFWGEKGFYTHAGGRK